jgi:hypothetical protein
MSQVVCQIRLKNDKWGEYLLSRVISPNSVLKKWAEVQLNGERIARILTRNSNRNDQRLPGEDMMIGFYFKI